MPPPFTPSPIRVRLVLDDGRVFGPDETGGFVFCGGEVYEDWRAFEDGVTLPVAARLLSTGLRDADGVEVFEGDFLDWTEDLGMPAGPVRQDDGAWWCGGLRLTRSSVHQARVTGHVYEAHVVEGRNRHGVTHYVEPDA